MSKKLDDINKQIADSKEKLKQLGNRKRTLERAERTKNRETGRQRHAIVGGIVEKYFPEVKRFEPKPTKPEEHTEFSPLAYFLSELAADKEAVTRYKAAAQRRMLAEAPPN